ncbi:MAG TPA: SUF system Fe-S cluster assembly protein [Methylophaga aminisulfidivorans]|uniref:SUF system Fe-S cluster assembly protein n=2 Tax=root TaxID=1 RepID=A0A7C1ZVJ8_9GAMM|nr:SUF system Fe-S cluster assembly protein [Methylophaga aminisulfidivorans]HEC75309.1 SUF system Fe-S cluster assembly protein [Methylophaga aminisulfidivorans]
MNDQYQISPEQLKEDVIEVLKTIYDPEIPVNIYELGLIYDIKISNSGNVNIDMTLTAPGCPVAQSFPGDVESRVMTVPGVSKAHVELVWEPQWTKDMMSEAVQLQLGMF